jgi:hypothetical protein
MVDTVVDDSASGNELPCLADDFRTPKVNPTDSQRNTETIVETSANGTPAAPLVAAKGERQSTNHYSQRAHNRAN